MEVDSWNLDDTDEPADLTNPVNRKLHEAAQRMLIEYPFRFRLNLDRNSPGYMAGALVTMIEKTMAALARLNNAPCDRQSMIQAATTIEVNPPPKVRQVTAKLSVLPGYCEVCEENHDEGKVTAFVTIKDFNSFVSAFEVEMDLE